MKFIKYPKRGDIVVKDFETKTPQYIDLDSYDDAQLDKETYEVVGAVADVYDGQVLVVYKENASKVWCTRRFYDLTGYTLDGTDRTGVISIRENSSASANVDTTFNYNATTMEQLCEQLNQQFQSGGAYKTQDWYAEVVDGKISIHLDWTFSSQSNNAGKDGFTFTLNIMPDVPYLASVRRKSGLVGGEGAISSWKRALTYFRNDNSSTSYNPNKDVTSIKQTYPICLPAYLGTSQYQSDHCAFLRSVYGEGEEGWLKFMRSCMPVAPCGTGNMSQDNGKERTSILAIKRYNSNTKTDTVLCPAADYVSNIASRTVEKGEFWLPTMAELQKIVVSLEYNTTNNRQADVLNTAMVKIGGSAVSNGSYYWSCLRGSAGVAWYSSGGLGYFSSYGMYGSYVALPVSLYKIA